MLSLWIYPKANLERNRAIVALRPNPIKPATSALVASFLYAQLQAISKKTEGVE